ncbi:MAG: glycosyltransferase family 39 protein [Chloroflexi bacterium]|nr:glycosyltransferase family 39 protein [Chloroflexota bacterium]
MKRRGSIARPRQNTLNIIETAAIRRVVLLEILVMLAFFLAIYRIDSQSLWWDETLSVSRARGDLAYLLTNKIIIFDTVTIDQHPPLYFLLLRLTTTAFGESEFALRFLSLAMILLSVPLLYQVGRQVWNRNAGFFSALAAAVSPFYVWYAQEARPYAQVVFLATLSTYLLLRLTRTRSARLLAGYLLVTAALLATHYLTGALFFAQVLYLVFHMIQLKDVRVLGALFAICGVGLVLVLFEAPNSIGRYLTQSGSPLAVGLDSVVRDVAVTFSFGVTVNQFAVLPFAAVLAALAVGGNIFRTRVRPREGMLLLWISLVVPLLVIYLVSLYKSVYGTRYVIFLAPIYYLILGQGGAGLHRYHPALGMLLGLFVFGAGAYGSYDYLVVNNNYRQDHREAVRYIMDHARDSDAIVLDDQKIVTAFEYYYKGKALLYGVPSLPGLSSDQVSTEIHQIAARHPRIWLDESMSGEIDPNDLVRRTLTERYYQLDSRVLTGVTYSIGLSLYSTTPYELSDLPADMVKRDVNFDNQLALLGYSLKRQDRPGNRLDIDLYWRVRKDGLQRLAVFGQLVDGEGNVWGSFDGEPFKGFFPTEWWSEGALIGDQRELWITPGAPPGKYTLRLGVRPLEADGSRLPIRDNSNRVLDEVAQIDDAVTLDEVIDGDSDTLALPTRYGASFGDQVTLLGGDSLSPLKASPGEKLDFRLFWRVQAGVPQDLDVQLSLQGTKGESVKNEILPISGAYPRSLWRQGQMIGAYYSLFIPAALPSGDYKLAMSVFPRGSATPLGVRLGLNPFAQSGIALGTVTVTSPDRQFTPPGSLKGPRAIIEGKIEMLGFDIVPVDGVTVARGSMPDIDIVNGAGPLGVSLWWRALSEVGGNYTVFVQVLDAAGRLVDQHDGIPGQGERPTAGWVPREVVQDDHALVKIPQLPKGNYLLIVGMYDSETKQRLSLPDANQDYVVIGSITIR